MVVKDSYRNPKHALRDNDNAEELGALRDILKYHYSEILKTARYQLLAQFAIALFAGAGLMFVIAIWLRG